MSSLGAAGGGAGGRMGDEAGGWADWRFINGATIKLMTITPK